MKKSDQLKAERKQKLDAQKTMIEARNASENKQFSNEESVKFNGLTDEIDALETQIESAEKIERAEARLAASAGNPIGAPAIVKSTKNETFSLMRSLHTLASGKQLVGIDAEINERGIAEMQEQGMEVRDGLRIHIPASMNEQRAQTITGDSGTKGGALVASTPQLVMPLMPNIDVLTALGVNVMDNLVGDVPLPASGLFTFAHVAETATVSATDVTFAGPTLKPKRCAGVGAMSNKFLRQTSFNAEQYLRSIINNAYGVAVIADFINGQGGDAPTGLIDLITTNIDTTATAPTKAIITALESLVDAANGTKLSRGYLSDTKLANTMKNVLLDAGSGRFLYDGKDLNGYKYETSTLVPELTGKHPLIFGDWKQATIGYWGNVSIMVDPYTLASSSQIKLIVEGFDDVAVANEKAFAINKVLTL